jgi:bromodomain-containing factor 1
MELDVEELPNEVLHDLWKLVKRFQKANNSKSVEEEPVDEDYEPAVAGARGGQSSAKPRKNKPMNATEQEAKIKALSEQLGRVPNGGSGEGSPTGAGRSPRMYLRAIELLANILSFQPQPQKVVMTMTRMPRKVKKSSLVHP